jgi:hypothetical protein
MQELDVRYALFLMPLFYVILPFILSGTFLILGGVGILAFISGTIILIIITNLNLGGSIQAVATGSGANVGMGSEGGYSLFVIVIGGLFYIGAQIAQFISPILDIFLLVINTIISFVGWIFGISTTGLQTSLVSGLGSTATHNLGNIYPLGIKVAGISVFGVLDIVMASLFILSLYFMVSSRGH